MKQIIVKSLELVKNSVKIVKKYAKNSAPIIEEDKNGKFTVLFVFL
jgi:hypothetical protein